MQQVGKALLKMFNPTNKIFVLALRGTYCVMHKVVGYGFLVLVNLSCALVVG